MTRRLTRLMLGASVMAVMAVMLTGPAMAQSGNLVQPLPPTDYNLDGNGVDLATGKLYLRTTDLTIGGPGGGLSYSRTRRALGTDDDYTTALNVNGSVIDVAIGSLRDTFAAGGGLSTSDTGATLAFDGTNYIYTDSSGTRYEFSASVYSEDYRVAQYRNTQVTFADGRYYTLTYDAKTLRQVRQGELDEYRITRPRLIQSSDGYNLVIVYQSNTASYYNNTQWFTVAGVEASNTTVSAGPWPSNAYSVDASGNETHTDPMGRQTVTTVDSALRIIGIKLPGDSAASTTFAYDGAGRVSSVTKAGGTWTYDYSDSGGERTTTVTTPTQLQQVAVSRIATGKVVRTRTGTAQVQQFGYDTKGRLTTSAPPEGNYTTFAYDANDNVTTQTLVAKNSQSSRTLSATFDCSVAINCHKPTTTTDAMGRVTEYEYSPVHGGSP